MLRRVNDALLKTLETYYDAAPRPSADTEEVGPFTLFVRTDPEGWPYYARPRLGLSVAVTVDDVAAVLARQEELGQPKSLEWVHETTPSLRDAARAAGLSVHECVLMHLPAEGQDLDVPSHVKVLAAARHRPADGDRGGPRRLRRHRRGAGEARRATAASRWSATCSPWSARTTSRGTSWAVARTARGVARRS